MTMPSPMLLAKQMKQTPYIAGVGQAMPPPGASLATLGMRSSARVCPIFNPNKTKPTPAR